MDFFENTNFISQLQLPNKVMSCSKNRISVCSPSNKKSMDILRNDNQNERKIELTPTHQHPITCIHQQDTILISASDIEVYVWDTTTDKPCTFKCIGRDLGNVSYISVSHDLKYVSLVIQSEIWILQIEPVSLIETFTHDLCTFEAAEFCQQDSNYLVSISEDGTYDIFDLVEKSRIYRSAVVSVSGLISLAMHPFERLFAVGSPDGKLNVFNMADSKPVHGLDMEIVISKEPGEEIDRGGCSIIEVKYLAKHKNIQDVDHILSILSEELYLVVGCTAAVFIFHANSMTLLSSLYFSQMDNLHVASTISVAIHQDEIYVYVIGCFSRKVHFFTALLNSSASETQEQLSVLSLEPLSEKSSLKAEYKARSQKAVVDKKKKTSTLHQPVIFHTKVQSSGYSKTNARSKMFEPRVNKAKPKSNDHKNKVGPWGAATKYSNKTKVEAVKYPMDDAPPTHFMMSQQIADKGFAIHGMKFSGSGKSVAMAMADGNGLLLKFPALAKQKPFVGHSKAVTSIAMNHANNLLVTSSTDNTVKLWNPCSHEPILNISHCKQSLSEPSKATAVDKTNTRFTKTIGGAMFYFNDKFILLSHGSTLCLYKYHVDTNRDDLKRYVSNNRYKLVHNYSHETVHNITTFSAVNSFYSYLVLCACSNRDLVVYDMNGQRVKHVINDTHTKPITNLTQYTGSSAVTSSNETYDLFVTSAPTGGVKLWDLRLARCVRKFEGHVNRSQKVGLAFSPCSKYIAVGSEDRAVYIYDIRSNSYVNKLPDHTDVVTALDFHPVTPTLVTGTLDGNMRGYDNL